MSLLLTITYQVIQSRVDIPVSKDHQSQVRQVLERSSSCARWEQPLWNAIYADRGTAHNLELIFSLAHENLFLWRACYAPTCAFTRMNNSCLTPTCFHTRNNAHLTFLWTVFKNSFFAEFEEIIRAAKEHGNSLLHGPHRFNQLCQPIQTKKRIQVKKHQAVLPHLQNLDVSHVEQVDSFFEGLIFCILVISTRVLNAQIFQVHITEKWGSPWHLFFRYLWQWKFSREGNTAYTNKTLWRKDGAQLCAVCNSHYCLRGKRFSFILSLLQVDVSSEFSFFSALHQGKGNRQSRWVWAKHGKPQL